MRPFFPLLLAALTACGSAVPDDTDTDTDTDTQLPAEMNSLVGAWQTQGDADGIGWLAGLIDGGTARVDHLSFAGSDGEAGILSIHVRDASGQLACETATWSRVRPGAILVSIEGRRRAGARLVLTHQPDADTLELTAEDGRTVSLEREEAVPDEARCPVVQVLSGVTVDAPFDGSSNLVFDGVGLRYPDRDMGPSALDLGTGALSSPWSFGFESDVYPATAQAGVPWNTCNCGANQRISYIQPGGVVVDEVDTVVLGRGISIRAAAGAPDGTLWLTGTALEGSSTWFLQVDTSGEPDVLVSEVESSARVGVMTEHRGAYYAVSQDYLYRVVPSTGEVDRTWVIDGVGDREWASGVASDGATLWVALVAHGEGARVVPVLVE